MKKRPEPPLSSFYAGPPGSKGRDLTLTTDFRTVVGEILAKHLGVRDLSGVFPGFDNKPHKFAGLIKT
jgi:uncharacterized protein (DUF1501 family)